MSPLETSIIAGIGERARLVREAYGDTQQVLAAVLGVERVTISSMETTRTRISPPALVRIAEHYHLSLQWLVTGMGPIFDASDGVRFLGDEEHASPCRTALQLMQRYPEPLDFVQIEYHDMGAQFGWVFRVNERKAIVILPGEEQPGPMVRAVAELLVHGHRFRGRMKLDACAYQQVCRREVRAEDVLQLFRRHPYHIGFPEFRTLDFLSPAQRTAIEQSLAAQEHRPVPSRAEMIQEIVRLVHQFPESTGPVLRLLQTHAAKRRKKRTGGQQASSGHP